MRAKLLTNDATTQLPWEDNEEEDEGESGDDGKKEEDDDDEDTEDWWWCRGDWQDINCRGPSSYRRCPRQRLQPSSHDLWHTNYLSLQCLPHNYSTIYQIFFFNPFMSEIQSIDMLNINQRWTDDYRMKINQHLMAFQQPQRHFRFGQNRLKTYVQLSTAKSQPDSRWRSFNSRLNGRLNLNPACIATVIWHANVNPV